MSQTDLWELDAATVAAWNAYRDAFNTAGETATDDELLKISSAFDKFQAEWGRWYVEQSLASDTQAV